MPDHNTVQSLTYKLVDCAACTLHESGQCFNHLMCFMSGVQGIAALMLAGLGHLLIQVAVTERNSESDSDDRFWQSRPGFGKFEKQCATVLQQTAISDLP